jgi:glyoxylase I family protein
MPPPFKLRDIDHVVLRVADMAGMRAFYEGVLGCTLEKVQDHIGLVQLRAGRSLIDLVDIAGTIGREGGAAAGREGRNMEHFCLIVDPFDPAAIAAHLEAHGVAAGSLANRYGAEGEGPSLDLRDPEDNGVELKGPGPR